MEHPRIERAFSRYFSRVIYEQKEGVANSDMVSETNESLLHAQIERENPAEEDASNGKKNSQHEFEIM